LTSRRCARQPGSTAGCACPGQTRRARAARSRSAPAVVLPPRWRRVYGL